MKLKEEIGDLEEEGALREEIVKTGETGAIVKTGETGVIVKTEETGAIVKTEEKEEIVKIEEREEIEMNEEGIIEGHLDEEKETNKENNAQKDKRDMEMIETKEEFTKKVIRSLVRCAKR